MEITPTTSNVLAPIVNAITPKIAQRKGDPLGINRPYIKPPPDIEPYDYEKELSEFSLSLMTPDALKQRNEDIEEAKKNPNGKIRYNEDGFYHIDTVRRLIRESCTKENIFPDPDIMIMIDANINYKIFIADNTVYTREDLYDNYAFIELDAIPEDFFSRQVIGVFDNGSEIVYNRKDEDDESMEFIQIKCMLNLDKDPNYKPIKPTKIVKTKIFIGGEQFTEFVNLQKQMRTIIKLKQRHVENPGSGQFLNAIMGDSQAMKNVLAIQGSDSNK